MPDSKGTLTNTTTDDLRVPLLGRVIKAGETVEAELEHVLAFAGHAHIRATLPDGSEPEYEAPRPKVYDLSWMHEDQAPQEAPQTSQEATADSGKQKTKETPAAPADEAQEASK